MVPVSLTPLSKATATLLPVILPVPFFQPRAAPEVTVKEPSAASVIVPGVPAPSSTFQESEMLTDIGGGGGGGGGWGGEFIGIGPAVHSTSM